MNSYLKYFTVLKKLKECVGFFFFNNLITTNSMINSLKNWFKLLSLSNCNNWEMYKERGWHLEMDGYSKPRKFYRHKKYDYFITNIYTNNPLKIKDLVGKFLKNYKDNNLLMGETYFTISN